MTKNIIVLTALLENGEVSTNDFAGLKKGNIRHLPRIINDARNHLEIYSERIYDKKTMEVLGMKYILPEEQEKKLKQLIYTKASKQLFRRQIGVIEHAYILRRLDVEW